MGGRRLLIIENFLKKLSFCKYLKQTCIKVQNLLRRTKRGVSGSLFLYFTSNLHSKGFKTPCVTPRTVNSLKSQLSHYQFEVTTKSLPRLKHLARSWSEHMQTDLWPPNSNLKGINQLDFRVHYDLQAPKSPKAQECKPIRPFFLVTSLR